MHRIFRVKAYEAEHGPHFNEEHARKAVSKMENEECLLVSECLSCKYNRTRCVIINKRALN